MAEAAAAEDFERAALLRNEIEELKGPSVRKPPPGQMGLGTNIPVAAPPSRLETPEEARPDDNEYQAGGKSR